jgi:hypothetical protein
MKIHFLILLLLPLIAHAGVYKWVDAKGQTHFGDRPPAENSAEEVHIDPVPPGNDPAAAERINRMNEFLNQRQAERQVQQAEDAKAARKAERQDALCRKLQAQLKHMASVSTFYNLNEKGERVFVSEAQNGQIRERFRERVEKACNRT